MAARACASAVAPGSAGLAGQDFQVVIQVQDLHALARCPLMPGCHGVLVIDGDY
jgi:hypothetical protein